MGGGRVLQIKLPRGLCVPGAFFTKVVELGATSLKFEIWDTAGQEKYHSVCHLYFRGANAALLVYDITSKVRLTLPGVSPHPSHGICPCSPCPLSAAGGIVFPKSSVQILASSACECGLIWEKGLCGCHW